MHLRILIGLLLYAGSVGAQSPLPANGSFSARNHIQYRTDSSGRMTLAQVWADSGRFRPVTTNRPSFGVGQSAHWLRFRVANPTPRALPLVVEIDNPYLAAVQLYAVSASGQLLLNSGPMGWSTLPIYRSSNHRNPLLHVMLPPDGQAWVYGRVDNHTQALRVPIRLWTATEFEGYDRQVRLFWYGLTGILGWLVFTNLILFMLLRERVYGLYSLYILFLTAYLTVSAGFWLEWFPRTHYGPVTARSLLSLLTCVSTITGFFFIRQYILLPVWSQVWVRSLFRTAVYLLGMAFFLVLLGVPYEWLYVREIKWMGPLMSVLFGLPVLLIFGLIGYQAMQSHTGLWQSPARLYLVAVLPLVVQSVCLNLRNYAVLPDHFLFGYEGLALSYLFEFAVLSVGLGFRYKRMADERLLLAQETARQQQQAVETQLRLQQQENRALEAQLQLKQERERIARDLHDHVGAQLSVIAANANTPPTTATDGIHIGEYAREAIQSLRDTVWAIDQPSVTLISFQRKLQQYLNRQQQQHPACRYTLTMNAPAGLVLSSAQALNLFRQVQEAVHNAFKHARATAVTVQCDLLNDHLHLSISDNGQGFDAGQLIDGSAHYGLRNLHRRATEMHGECCIESEPGQGTTVSVTIPLTV